MQIKQSYLENAPSTTALTLRTEVIVFPFAFRTFSKAIQ